MYNIYIYNDIYIIYTYNIYIYIYIIYMYNDLSRYAPLKIKS